MAVYPHIAFLINTVKSNIDQFAFIRLRDGKGFTVPAYTAW